MMQQKTESGQNFAQTTKKDSFFAHIILHETS
jgi:hypothetical protein